LKWAHPPRPGLPVAEDVVAMRGAMWAEGSHGYFETGVPEFTVPTAQVGRIWRRFDRAEYVRDPQVVKGQPLGELVVTTRSGVVVRVTFFASGLDHLVFTANGTDFFQTEPRGDLNDPLGGGLALAGTLRHLSFISASP
jgi:hypothetical protein